MKEKIKENLKDKISNKLLGKEKEAEYKVKNIGNKLKGAASKVVSNIKKASSKIKNAYNRKNVSPREFFSSHFFSREFLTREFFSNENLIKDKLFRENIIIEFFFNLNLFKIKDSSKKEYYSVSNKFSFIENLLKKNLVQEIFSKTKFKIENFSCTSLTLIYSFCFFSILSLFVNCKGNPILAQNEQGINESEQNEVYQNNLNNNDSIQNKPNQSDLDKTIQLYDNFEKTTLENKSTHHPYRTAWIYVTERTYDGKFGPYFSQGGIKAADAACNDRNEKNKLNSRSYYKALIGIPGERAICNTPFCINDSFTKENPLQPNTAYFRINSVKLIGRTYNQGIFLKPLFNSFAGGDKKYYWTGLTRDWLNENEKNCNEFNSNDVEQVGRVSDTTKKQFNNSEESAISSVDLNCSTRNSIVCVEQHD